MLFAFETETGELQSYHEAGSELRRVALSEKTHSVAAVRSSLRGDEVTIINFDVVTPDGTTSSGPLIDSMSPEVADQGRIRNLKLTVAGKNLTEGSSLLVNGVEMGADLVKQGSALEATLPKGLFDQVSSISVVVKGADGSLSQPRELKVVRPDAPTVDRISPSQVPGPSTPFILRVSGKNFRPSSAVVVDGRPLNTRLIGTNMLEAIVPAEIAGSATPDAIKDQVKDLALPDLVSGTARDLQIFGPRIRSLRTDVGRVVAGGRTFSLTIQGDNFRAGAQVDLRMNGDVYTVVDARRFSSRVIAVTVPGHVFQDSGKLAVTVRNPGGGESDQAQLQVRAPEINGFTQKRLFAGSSDVSVDIRGENFRKRTRVYVGNARVDNQHVRFRSSNRLTVTLTGELNKLLEKPKELRFQVVNPNQGDGVPSTDKALSIVGPSVSDISIEPVSEDDSQVRLVIRGENFLQGAMVEFFKVGLEDAPILQRKPSTVAELRLTVLMSAKTLDRIGNYRVRVVNP